MTINSTNLTQQVTRSHPAPAGFFNGAKQRMDYEKKPYFASHDGVRYRLEKNDALGIFEWDDDAVTKCIEDALNGSKYALIQLLKAADDPLVHEHIAKLP